MKKLLILAIIFLSKFSVNSQTGIEIFSNKLASQYLGNRPGALVIGVYNNGVQQIFIMEKRNYTMERNPTQLLFLN
ncbi:MAG: hypothetical protein IPF75_19440 [Bacteroidetes bacterium]|nr:hypothetical protein [Bacteroidota bacterium]